jgi:hypothetical protein
MTARQGSRGNIKKGIPASFVDVACNSQLHHLNDTDADTHAK